MSYGALTFEYRRPKRASAAAGSRLSLASVRRELAKRSVTISFDIDDDEYTVDFAEGTKGYKPGTDGSVYFTNDLEDAYRTGLSMADWRDAS